LSDLISLGCGIEFGWLVARFIPRLRSYSSKFEKTIVVCEPGTEYLFHDITDIFEPFHFKGRSERWLYEARQPNIKKRIMDKYPGAVKFLPSEKTCMHGSRIYKKYGEKLERSLWDIVIHARSENKYRSDNRNWPIKKWDKLMSMFTSRKVACIGSKTGSIHIKGATDLRGINMKPLCDLLSNSKVVIGPSSGPMHLASFCGANHVVWTDNKYQKVIKANNRKRYEKLWNPLKTPVTVIDEYGWNPPVKVVAQRISKILEAL